MRKTQKFAVVCCCMAGAGLILCGAGFAMGGRVFGIGVGAGGIWVDTPESSENGKGFVEDKKELEAFGSIDIDMDSGRLVIEPSDHYGISYRVDGGKQFSAKVENGCLMVSARNVTQGVTFLAMGPLNDEYIKVYIPADASFDTVDLYNESGPVTCSGFYADSLQLQADFGDVDLQGVGSKKADIVLESGNLELSDFEDGDLTVLNEFGRAVLDSITADMIDITMESGNLTADKVKGESLNVDQSFGKVEFSDTTITGKAELISESGDMKLVGFDTGTMELTNDFGKITGGDIKAGTGIFRLESGDCKLEEVQISDLDINSDFGNVKLGMVKPVTEYTLALETDFGSVKVNGEYMGASYKSLETMEKRLQVFCESGNIEIKQSK